MDIFLLLVIFQFIAGAYTSGWSYSDIGEWEGYCQDGMKQSPINIERSLVKENKTLGRFTRKLFKSIPRSMEILNNGHALQVNIEGGCKINDPSLLPGTYTAVQYHFHWGAAGSPGGSEHTVNDKRYFAEMHIVHLNDAAGDNFLTTKNGLAVLGFFIEASSPINNTGFDKILSYGRNVRYEGDTFEITATFPIKELLPRSLKDYYRYSGSLTTPDCNEVVVWTVFRRPIKISYAQKVEWQSLFYDGLEGEEGLALIGNNFRPCQNLFDRIVTKPAKVWKK